MDMKRKKGSDRTCTLIIHCPKVEGGLSLTTSSSSSSSSSSNHIPIYLT